jgi:hypothetical protein
MNLKKAEIPLFLLVGLLIIVIFVLILTGHAVPTYLYAILGAVLTGGLGLAVPSSTSTELPAEVSELVGDLRKVFASLTAPAPTTTPTAAVPVVPAAAPTAPAPAPVAPVALVPPASQ